MKVESTWVFLFVFSDFLFICLSIKYLLPGVMLGTENRKRRKESEQIKMGTLSSCLQSHEGDV